MRKRKPTTTTIDLPPLLLTIEQAGAMLGGVSRTKVYRLINQEGLPVVKLGNGDMRVSLEGLKQWVASRETCALPPPQPTKARS